MKGCPGFGSRRVASIPLVSGAPRSTLGACQERREQQSPCTFQAGADPYPCVETGRARSNSSGIWMDTEEIEFEHPLIFELKIKGFRQDILLGLSDFGPL